ncbi:hypothetical protein QBC42DRAFT_112327 [Cladorrhinum samala]|uniref:Uncharacterized protein n=1 Tax=Cladorrhinum samala TaxID=585594 RepID=A0AAV9HGT0_9PEZI|nr:hypothetical protein QBC42DRAFT_112327 [Cladorrhinum samala]
MWSQETIRKGGKGAVALCATQAKRAWQRSCSSQQTMSGCVDTPFVVQVASAPADQNSPLYPARSNMSIGGACSQAAKMTHLPLLCLGHMGIIWHFRLPSPLLRRFGLDLHRGDHQRRVHIVYRSRGNILSPDAPRHTLREGDRFSIRSRRASKNVPSSTQRFSVLGLPVLCTLRDQLTFLSWSRRILLAGGWISCQDHRHWFDSIMGSR